MCLPRLAARLASIEQNLPFTLTPRLTAPLITGCMALVFSAIGGLLFWTTWQDGRNGDSTMNPIRIGCIWLGHGRRSGALLLHAHRWLHLAHYL